MRRFGFLLALAAGSLGLAISAASIADYPAARDNYLNDFAGVIQPVDAQMLQDQLRQLERSTRIEGTVVTVNTVSEYGTGDLSIEQFATNLFNRWGVGNPPANDGFMVLVAVKDRALRIELGKGYGSRYNDKMRQIVDKIMLPRFRAGEYSRGIYEGTTKVVDTLSMKPSWFSVYGLYLVAGGIAVVLLLFGISLVRNGQKGWGYALIAAAAALLMFIFTRLLSIRGGGAPPSDRDFGGGSSSGGGGASGKW